MDCYHHHQSPYQGDPKDLGERRKRWMALRPAWAGAMLIFFGVLLGAEVMPWLQSGFPSSNNGRAVNVLASQKLSDEQLQAIARGVFKYASDRALRLMLSEPKGNFSTVGEKVFQNTLPTQKYRSLLGFHFQAIDKPN